jgi:DNA-binding IclR family transcriptional regulator
MNAASDKGSPGRRRIRSIEVGFRVIHALLAAQRPTPLRDIAAAAGMTPSKAHLYLASFVREGMAFQDPETGHYGLGPFAVRLGLSAIRQLSIVDEARSYLRQLSDRTGCGAYLSILGETGPAIVSKADGIRHGALSVQHGYVLPLTSSATGQIFLAYLAPARRTALLDRDYANASADDDSYVPRKKLDVVLAKVLKLGFATTAGQVNANFVAAAAPVFDHNGDIAATLTVLGPDKYLAGGKLKESVTALLEMAAGLSRAIGAPGPDEPRLKKPSRPI